MQERVMSYREGAFKYGISFAGLGFALIAILSIYSIRQSLSSTAAIGYLFVPLVSIIGAIPFFVFGYSFRYLQNWYFSRGRPLDYKVLLAFAVAGILFLSGAKFVVEGIYLTGLVHKIETMDEAELKSIFSKPLFGKNKFVLGVIAQNKNANGELLHAIVMLNDEELHERMGSVFDVMGANRRGYAVMRLVASHPNVLPVTLEHLSNSRDTMVLEDVLANPKIPADVLQRFIDKRNIYIDSGLSRNPATPQNILSILSDSNNEYTRANVARNPNTKLSDLEKLASDREWHVRRSIVDNPHTSIDLLKKLSEDSDERVRIMVAFNKNSTTGILLHLVNDNDSGVSQAAEATLQRRRWEQNRTN